MPIFGFHKIFRLGMKAGKEAKTPSFTVEASSSEEAEKLSVDRKKSGVDYVCRQVRDVDALPARLTKRPAQQTVVAGRDPNKADNGVAEDKPWELRERCWITVSPFEDTYVEATILSLTMTEKYGMCASLWADIGGFRDLPVSQLKRKPPRKRKSKNVNLTLEQQKLLRPNSSLKRKSTS